MPDPTNEPRVDAWARLVADKLRHLRYGVIQLTVHDGRVVQVDCTERVRLSTDALLPRTQHLPPST